MFEGGGTFTLDGTPQYRAVQRSFCPGGQGPRYTHHGVLRM